MCHSELSDTAKSLEQRGVQQDCLPRHEFYNAPDGIVECLGVGGMRPALVQPSKYRFKPSVNKATEGLPERRCGCREIGPEFCRIYQR